MATAKRTDKFANTISVDITMSAADTLTFEEIDVGLNIFDKVGLLLHRMDAEVNAATIGFLNDNTDNFEVGLTQSNQIASMTLQERAMIDKIKISMHSEGTLTNEKTAGAMQEPFNKDWSGLPGGGLLITPRPLYLCMDSIGAAVAGFCTVRLYFTIVQLKPEEYFELLESRRFYG